MSSPWEHKVRERLGDFRRIGVLDVVINAKQREWEKYRDREQDGTKEHIDYLCDIKSYIDKNPKGVVDAVRQKLSAGMYPNFGESGKQNVEYFQALEKRVREEEAKNTPSRSNFDTRPRSEREKISHHVRVNPDGFGYGQPDPEQGYWDTGLHRWVRR